jgi:sulfite exporter TauE/SafE
MLLFGVGAALPLLLLGTLSREVLMRWRDRMMGVGKGLKAALGLILVVTGAVIVLGYDKVLETGLVNASPAWLTDLTTGL